MKIVKKNKTYFINPDSLDEENNLDFFLNKPLNLEKKESLLILSILENNVSVKENNASVKENNVSVKQKIIDFFNDENLTFKNRVEGTFEKLLNKDDLIVFKEMIKNKEIEIFKPSTKYKKGIYQISFKKAHTSSSNFGAVHSFFIKNKYIILNNSEDAKKFSNDFETEIKEGKIIGLKSFDNNYYVINKDLFLDIKTKLINLNLNSSFSIGFLETKLDFSKDAFKIAIELLKEEGLIIEKKKENYEFI